MLADFICSYEIWFDNIITQGNSHWAFEELEGLQQQISAAQQFF